MGNEYLAKYENSAKIGSLAEPFKDIRNDLLQGFMEIQMKELFGDEWMEYLLLMIDCFSEESKKRFDYIIKVRKQNNTVKKEFFDITALNALVNFNCYNFFCTDGGKQQRDKLVSSVQNIINKKQGNKEEIVKTLFSKNCPVKVHKDIRHSQNDNFYNHFKYLIDSRNENEHFADSKDHFARLNKITNGIAGLSKFCDYLNNCWKEYPNNDERRIFVNRFSLLIEELKNDANKIRLEPEENIGLYQESKDTGENSNFITAFKLLSDKATHQKAKQSLEKDCNNACAFSMRVFLEGLGKENYKDAEDKYTSLEASFIYDVDKLEGTDWKKQAFEIKHTNKEYAIAYLIGYAAATNNVRAYYDAALLSSKIRNYEVAKECFRRAQYEIKEAKQIYQWLHEKNSF